MVVMVRGACVRGARPRGRGGGPRWSANARTRSMQCAVRMARSCVRGFVSAAGGEGSMIRKALAGQRCALESRLLVPRGLAGGHSTPGIPRGTG